MSKLIYKITVATFSLFLFSSCTYWPSANLLVKDQFLSLFQRNSINSLNVIAALLLAPSSIDTTPGTHVNLTANSDFYATWIDVNGDSISDGLDLVGNGIPNILLLDLNSDGKPDSLDTNGDGVAEYFLNISSRGGVLRTGGNGTGNPVFLILNDSKEILGFDTDGDGVSNDTLIAEILKDKSAPLLSINPNSGTYAPETGLTFYCNDNKAPGHVIYTLDSSDPSFNPLNGIVKHPAVATEKFKSDGVYTVTSVCRDLNGNVSNKIVKTYTIDSSIPNLQIVRQTSRGVSSNIGAISQSTTFWKSSHSGNYTLRGNSNSCSDGNILSSGSVVAETEYSFQRNASDFIAEGVYYFRICFVSTNGRSVESNFSLFRDDTAPIVSASVGSGNYGTEPLPTLSCSDVGGSGCNGIVYTLNSSGIAPDPVFDPVTGNITTGTAYGLSAISMPNLSTTSLKFQARDSAGNVSAINLNTYVIDTDLPIITVNSFSNVIRGSVNPSISWRSNKAGTYQFRIGGTDCSTGIALTGGFPNINVVGSVAANTNRSSTINRNLFNEGDNTIRICFTSSFGVLGSITRTITRDTVAPIVTIVSPIGPGPFPSGTQITLQCTDTNGSGCKNIGYYTSDDEGEVTFNGLGDVSTGTLYTGPISVPDGLLRISYVGNDMALNMSTYTTTTMQIGYPDAPNFMKAIGSDTSIFLEWLPTSSATSYSVFYDTNPGVNLGSTRIDGITNPYINLTGLTPNTTYYFKLQAHSSLGSSGQLTSYETKALTASTPMGFNVSGSYADISAGQGTNSGEISTSRIDVTNQKLIVTARNFANSFKPSVYICDLDGTNCVYKDVSAGQASATLITPTLEIDTLNQKLLIAGTDSGNSNLISLFRCDLNGNNCTHHDVSGGVGTSVNAILLLDAVFKKLIVISRVSDFNLAYSRCNLDGTNCLGGMVPVPGAAGAYVKEMQATIDPLSQKVLIVTRDGSNGDRLSLIRCSLMVNNCTLTDASAGQPTGTGFFPQIGIDVLNSKIIMTARNQTTGFLGFFRCELDGSNCSFRDISTGVVISAERHSTKLDLVNRKVLVAASENTNIRAYLFRSDLDGTNVSSLDISLGMNLTGNTPSLSIDAINGRTVVVTTNLANQSRLGLFIR
ncbi:fibronectin type III domain-containing protein (plasmid) [Leptospira sp. WS60.C2]